MKYLEGERRIELTRRNLTTLLAKLDDPLSARTLAMNGFAVIAVMDDEHYETRPAGVVYMPTSGEWL